MPTYKDIPNSRLAAVKASQPSKQPMIIKRPTTRGKKLSDATMARLREHAKKHKGGMNSKHMRDMVRQMKAGDSCSTAHSKAMGGGGSKGKKKNGTETVTLDGEEVEFKEGTLRSQLKVPKDMKLTKAVLMRINKTDVGDSFDFNGRNFKMTPLMKKRVTLGINLQK